MGKCEAKLPGGSLCQKKTVWNDACDDHQVDFDEDPPDDARNKLAKAYAERDEAMEDRDWWKKKHKEDTASLMEMYHSATANCAEARARVRTLLSERNGECWLWQGDGEDHPESMVSDLPVIIRAGDLRDLLSKRK